MPRPERRALLEGFARYVNLSRLSRATKRVTIYWRDDSASVREVTRESRGFFWEDDELEQLRVLVDSSVDQVEILRTFPNHTWRALQERYAYNFGKGTGRKRIPESGPIIVTPVGKTPLSTRRNTLRHKLWRTVHTL